MDWIVKNTIALQMPPVLQKSNIYDDGLLISKLGVFRGYLKEAQGGP